MRCHRSIHSAHQPTFRKHEPHFPPHRQKIEKRQSAPILMNTLHNRSLGSFGMGSCIETEFMVYELYKVGVCAANGGYKRLVPSRRFQSGTIFKMVLIASLYLNVQVIAAPPVFIQANGEHLHRDRVCVIGREESKEWGKGVLHFDSLDVTCETILIADQIFVKDGRFETMGEIERVNLEDRCPVGKLGAKGFCIDQEKNSLSPSMFSGDFVIGSQGGIDGSYRILAPEIINFGDLAGDDLEKLDPKKGLKRREIKVIERSGTVEERSYAAKYRVTDPVLNRQMSVVPYFSNKALSTETVNKKDSIMILAKESISIQAGEIGGPGNHALLSLEGEIDVRPAQHVEQWMECDSSLFGFIESCHMISQTYFTPSVFYGSFSFEAQKKVNMIAPVFTKELAIRSEETIRIVGALAQTTIQGESQFLGMIPIGKSLCSSERITPTYFLDSVYMESRKDIFIENALFFGRITKLAARNLLTISNRKENHLFKQVGVMPSFQITGPLGLVRAEWNQNGVKGGFGYPGKEPLKAVLKEDNSPSSRAISAHAFYTDVQESIKAIRKKAISSHSISFSLTYSAHSIQKETIGAGGFDCDEIELSGREVTLIGVPVHASSRLHVVADQFNRYAVPLLSRVKSTFFSVSYPWSLSFGTNNDRSVTYAKTDLSAPNLIIEARIIDAPSVISQNSKNNLVMSIGHNALNLEHGENRLVARPVSFLHDLNSLTRVPPPQKIFHSESKKISVSIHKKVDATSALEPSAKSSLKPSPHPTRRDYQEAFLKGANKGVKNFWNLFSADTIKGLAQFGEDLARITLEEHLPFIHQNPEELHDAKQHMFDLGVAIANKMYRFATGDGLTRVEMGAELTIEIVLPGTVAKGAIKVSKFVKPVIAGAVAKGAEKVTKFVKPVMQDIKAKSHAHNSRAPKTLENPATRAMTYADLGPTFDDAKARFYPSPGYFFFKDRTLTAHISLIKAKFQYSVPTAIENLKRIALANGADTLVIEAQLINERLCAILEKRYGLAPKKDILGTLGWSEIVIPLKKPPSSRIIQEGQIPTAWLGSKATTAQIEIGSYTIIDDGAGAYISLRIDGLYANGEKRVLSNLIRNIEKTAHEVGVNRCYLTTEFRNQRLETYLKTKYNMRLIEQNVRGADHLYEIPLLFKEG